MLFQYLGCALADPIGWVIGIGGPSVRIDLVVEASTLERLLATAVAGRAERLERTGEKFVPVTAMRLDMVRDSCCNGKALRLAHSTQRLEPFL